jgi:small subunit ribosomal protein S6
LVREYEFTVIANAQLPDSDVGTLIEKYESIMLSNGGEILRKNVWGSKKLAFPIKSQFRGFYVSYDLVAEPDQMKEAERLMRIDDNILRYLSVLLDKEVDIAARKEELIAIEAETAKRVAQAAANNN